MKNVSFICIHLYVSHFFHFMFSAFEAIELKFYNKSYYSRIIFFNYIYIRFIKRSYTSIAGCFLDLYIVDATHTVLGLFAHNLRQGDALICYVVT